jgi:hypothetical protein
MVDDSSAYHPALTAKDYLPKITRMFQAQQVQLIQEGAELSVGNHRFYRADYKRPIGYQAVLCTDWKGYVFTWTFVAHTIEQLEELVTSLNDASF